MRVDHAFAPVQFGEHRREGGITEVFRFVIGIEADAVGLEGVERVFDFVEAALDVGERQRHEEAEAAG